MNQSINKPRDVYNIVTNRIIELLERGVVPWQQPWTEAGVPRNLISGKPYRGVNVWLLNSLNYQQNCFLTFKQVQNLGGKVKKGEKAQEVVFWKWTDRENKETGEMERVPILKYYHVFNIDQCTDIPEEKLPFKEERKEPPLETCEKIIREMPKRPVIQYSGGTAFYNRMDDFINVPRRETFRNNEGFYATLFHELVHSTGHSARLNRRELLESKGMRSQDYAVEELTAEMGASYLKSYAGIPIEQLENNAAYIEAWLGRLRKDKRFIVHASAQAQKATDYILNQTVGERELGERSIEEENVTDSRKTPRFINRADRREKSSTLER